VRSSSLSGASGFCVVGRIPLKVPGAGAKGNMIALYTSEWQSREVAEFVRQQRFEIVSFWIGCQRLRESHTPYSNRLD
jgi:hypothetical protein